MVKPWLVKLPRTYGPVPTGLGSVKWPGLVIEDQMCFGRITWPAMCSKFMYCAVGRLTVIGLAGGVLLHVAEREGHVSGGERGAVVPLHALADREGDRLAAVAPLVG